MTDAPRSKRVIITNQEQLDKFIEDLESTAQWGGIRGDKPYEKGKFFIEIEQGAEWFYSKERHDIYLEEAKIFNGPEF